jgi:F-type H+-transporting ATPase subunit a
MKMNKLNTILSPLDQFEIRDLFSLNVSLLGNSHFSLTNTGLYLLIGLFITITYSLLATNNNKIVPNS